MKSWNERLLAVVSFFCNAYLQVTLAVVVFLVVTYLAFAAASVIFADTIDVESPEEAATQIVRYTAGVTVSPDRWQKVPMPGTSSLLRENDFVLTCSEEGGERFRVRVHKVVGRGWEEASYEDLRTR